MSRRKIVTAFDEHDYEQIELLARINKVRLSEIVRRLCQAYLDKVDVTLRGVKQT
ncbi:hypothetical protein [Bradyrhizobium elkanii]|uniref:hypothetical protein n=1 Tax=Bradyrhizobium elkanii TaxID=29448 RepID=UPI0004B89BFD|nr:hypothetical protein [Bradyrhizobium elkanii]WLA79623.1 hypothetical protein QNJ99_30030 [Bradyrhizobium elkanii]